MPKLVQTILNASSSISASTEKSNNKNEKNSYAIGSEDTAELEERTAGNKELEKQLDIIKELASSVVKQAAKKEGVKNLKKESVLPPRKKILEIAEKALLDKDDKAAKSRSVDVITDVHLLPRRFKSRLGT